MKRYFELIYWSFAAQAVYFGGRSIEISRKYRENVLDKLARQNES